MSKPVYLYRAVLTVQKRTECDLPNGDDLVPVVMVARPGTPVGRKTGYLSKSSAIDAAYRNGLLDHEFEVVRSEPVEFLTDTERLRRQIQRLTAQLAELEAVTA